MANTSHSNLPIVIGSPSTTGQILCLLMIVVLVVAMAAKSEATSYYSVSDNDLTDDLIDDYNDSVARLLLARKRISPSSRRKTCLRRNASCDHRPNDCCFNSNCRCNLWGTNCKCQRMGLFQRWG